MHISYLASGEFLYHLLTLLDPSSVKLCHICECWLDIHLDRLLTSLPDGNKHLLSAFHPQKTVPVCTGLDFCSIDCCDDVSFLDFRIGDIQCTALDDFLDADAVTLVFIVREDSEACGVQT